jgi:hypothetical protein
VVDNGKVEKSADSIGNTGSSALMKNGRFVLTKNDRHREHDLARANDRIDL